MMTFNDWLHKVKGMDAKDEELQDGNYSDLYEEYLNSEHYNCEKGM